MTVNIPLQITTGGSQQAVADFEAIQRSIQQTARESSSVTALAQSLGQTYKEAKQLATSLELTAEETAQAVAVMKQLKSVGADSATQFQVLQGKMGLTVNQFESLNAAISGQKQSIAQVVNSYTALAKTLGVSYEEAEAFAKALGLTAQQAQQAIGELRNLDSVGGSTALKYQVLEDTLGITIDQFEKLEAAAKGAINELEQGDRASSGFSNILQGIGQGIGQAGFGAIANTLSQLPGQIAGPTLQFEKFKTVLNTLYGDAEKADDAFANIQNFAATTPFELGEVTDAFIKLKNRGIEPTNELLKNSGDIASSQGKSLDQFIEAILDATTGEFERLKEFGIKASQAGDKVSFTFKGVTQTVDKTPEAIQGAIQAIGQMEGVAGGMEAQSKTLGGSLSNLQDNVTKVMVSFGEELIPVMAEFVGAGIEGAASMEDFARAAGKNVAEVLKVLANTLKFVTENASLFQAILAVVIAQMVALRAIALYQTLLQLAAGMTGAAAGTATFSTILQAASMGLKAFRAAAIAAAPAFVALGSAVALIALVKLTADLKAANEEFDAMAANATASSNEFGRIAGKVKGLNDTFTKNGTLTAEQQKLAKGYIQVSKSKIKAIDEEIARAKAIAPANEEQRNAQASLVAGLEQQRRALETQTTTLENNLETIKKRTKGIENAEDAEKRLKEITKGVESGKISEADALKQLEAIKNNAKAGEEAQNEAADAILKIRKDQIDAEVETINAGQSEIEARVKAGTLSEANAEQQLTELKRQEILKRLELNKAQQANAGSASEKQKLIAEQRQLEAQLTANDAEAQQARKDKLIEDFEEQQAILEGQYAQGKVSREEYNKQLQEIALKQNDAELKQLQDQLQKLDASDKEGREAINAQIGKVMKKRGDILREAYQREVQQIEAANDKALDASKLAETQRQIEIAKLEKSGAISQEQAEDQRSAATVRRIDAELAAEQQKFNQLKALKASAPEDEEKKQDDLRASQQKIAELTLQRIQQERNAEEALQKAAIASIKERQAAQQNRTREAVLGIQAEIAELRRQEQAQQAILRSLDREQTLMQSSYDLAQALTNAEINRYDRQVQGLNTIAGLVRDVAKADEEAALAGITDEEERKRIAAERQQAELDHKRNLLQVLGVQGTSEAQLVLRKQALEDAQAAAKRKAQLAEQALAQQQLVISNRKAAIEARLQLIAAKRADFEAQIALKKQEQAVLDAKAELAQAKLIKDPKERKQAVAEAQTTLKEAQQGLGLAKDEAKFAKDNVAFAQQNITDTASLADNQQKTLDIQQRSATEIANQEEGLRKMNQALELSQTGAEGFAASLQKAADASGFIQSALSGGTPQARRLGGSVQAGQPYLVGEEGPELITPSRSGWVFTARQTARILADVQPRSPFELPSGTVSQIVSLRRDAAMLTELKALRQQVEAMRPVHEQNTFHLNSNQLVADAAELRLKVAQSRLRRSRR